MGVDLYRTDRPAYGVNGTYGAYIYNAELQRIIHAYADGGRPLFIYCALQDQHAPQQVTPEFRSLFNGSYTRQYAIYNGMGSAADSVFGNATRALRESGMWGNTLVVMTSDNGGPSGVDGGDANNWPLRGGKKTEFEGGVRVNAFLSGGFIPPALWGQRRDGYLHVCDWYATLLPLAGADSADDQPGVPPIDGLDMWGYITGKVKDSPRTEMMLSNQFKRGTLFSAALIVGDYKLILGTQPYGFWQGPIFPNETVSQVCAYEPGSQRGFRALLSRWYPYGYATEGGVHRLPFVYQRELDTACCFCCCTVGSTAQLADRRLHYGLPLQHPNRPFGVRGAQRDGGRAQRAADGSMGAAEWDDLRGGTLPARYGTVCSVPAEPRRLPWPILRQPLMERNAERNTAAMLSLSSSRYLSVSLLPPSLAVLSYCWATEHQLTAGPQSTQGVRCVQFGGTIVYSVSPIPRGRHGRRCKFT